MRDPAGIGPYVAKGVTSPSSLICAIEYAAGLARSRAHVVLYKNAFRILMHSFNFRAQGPEADRLAQYRKTQFLWQGPADRVCRTLDPATIPGSSLTLTDWAAGRSTKTVRKEDAQPAESTRDTKRQPPPPLPEIPLHPLER